MINSLIYWMLVVLLINDVLIELLIAFMLVFCFKCSNGYINVPLFHNPVLEFSIYCSIQY